MLLKDRSDLKKIQNIQALRGVAVLSVVLFHLLLIERKYGGSISILPNIFYFGLFGVDLFFVLSGFVMVVVTRGKFQIWKQAKRFLYHRVSRIYPTYWFFTILTLIVFFIQPSWVNSSQGNRVDILASFLLFPSHTLPLVMVGWTLIHEMYFYIIFFIILLFVSENFLPVAIFLWGLFIVAFNRFSISTNPLFMLISHPLTIEFICGCFLALLYYRKDIIFKVRTLIIAALLILVCSLYGYVFNNNITGHIAPLSWWRVLIFGIPAMFLVFCFTNAEKKGYVIHSSIIKIGDASYSIYLAHILTLSAAGRVWSIFSTDAIYDNIIMLPILFFLVIMVGFVSYRFIEKPLLNLCR